MRTDESFLNFFKLAIEAYQERKLDCSVDEWIIQNRLQIPYHIKKILGIITDRTLELDQSPAYKLRLFRRVHVDIPSYVDYVLEKRIST